MTPQSPSPAAIGVVLGYATAASMVLMIFVQLGLFAVLLAPVMCVLHWVTARGHDSVNASHHRFLARTWLYAIIAQLAVLAALGFAFAEVWNLGAIIIDAVAAAQPGEEAAMAYDSLGLSRLYRRAPAVHARGGLPGAWPGHHRDRRLAERAAGAPLAALERPPAGLDRQPLDQLLRQCGHRLGAV